MAEIEKEKKLDTKKQLLSNYYYYTLYDPNNPKNLYKTRQKFIDVYINKGTDNIDFFYTTNPQSPLDKNNNICYLNNNNLKTESSGKIVAALLNNNNLLSIESNFIPINEHTIDKFIQDYKLYHCLLIRPECLYMNKDFVPTFIFEKVNDEYELSFINDIKKDSNLWFEITCTYLGKMKDIPNKNDVIVFNTTENKGRQMNLFYNITEKKMYDKSKIDKSDVIFFCSDETKKMVKHESSIYEYNDYCINLYKKLIKYPIMRLEQKNYIIKINENIWILFNYSDKFIYGIKIKDNIIFIHFLNMGKQKCEIIDSFIHNDMIIGEKEETNISTAINDYNTATNQLNEIIEKTRFENDDIKERKIISMLYIRLFLFNYLFSNLYSENLNIVQNLKDSYIYKKNFYKIPLKTDISNEIRIVDETQKYKNIIQGEKDITTLINLLNTTSDTKNSLENLLFTELPKMEEEEEGPVFGLEEEEEKKIIPIFQETKEEKEKLEQTIKEELEEEEEGLETEITTIPVIVPEKIIPKPIPKKIIPKPSIIVPIYKTDPSIPVIIPEKIKPEPRPIPLKKKVPKKKPSVLVIIPKKNIPEPKVVSAPKKGVSPVVLKVDPTIPVIIPKKIEPEHRKPVPQPKKGKIPIPLVNPSIPVIIPEKIIPKRVPKPVPGPIKIIPKKIDEEEEEEEVKEEEEEEQKKETALERLTKTYKKDIENYRNEFINIKTKENATNLVYRWTLFYQEVNKSPIRSFDKDIRLITHLMADLVGIFDKNIGIDHIEKHTKEIDFQNFITEVKHLEYILYDTIKEKFKSDKKYIIEPTLDLISIELLEDYQNNYNKKDITEVLEREQKGKQLLNQINQYFSQRILNKFEEMKNKEMSESEIKDLIKQMKEYPAKNMNFSMRGTLEKYVEELEKELNVPSPIIPPPEILPPAIEEPEEEEEEEEPIPAPVPVPEPAPVLIPEPAPIIESKIVGLKETEF